MNKGVIAYLVVLVLIVAIAFFLGVFNKTGPGKTTTTTAMTTVSNTVTTVPANGINETTTLPTTTVHFSNCMSKNAIEGITNGDFSSGTYLGWNTSGPGFGSAPFNIIYANGNNLYYGAPWSNYNGAYIATTYTQGLNLQAGNLTSNKFLVTELYLNFKIVSAQNNFLYVEIVKDNQPVLVAHYNTFAAANNRNGPTTFENASIPLGTLLCQNVSIKVVADVVGSSYPFEYIAAGDFYMDRVPVSTPGIVVNQTIS